jgi:hypothetical protein
MNTYEVLVNGVDFDFQDASPLMIDQIADDFGGESYCEHLGQRVTYMFQNPYLVPMSKLEKIQANMSEIGRSTEELYGCKYVGNELYLCTNEEGAISLSELGIDFYFRHV